jgi:hypothetical protein
VLTTPIDTHLPLIAAVVLVCGWAARRTRWQAAAYSALPLVVAVMMLLTDERQRLLAYGVIVAGAFACALAAFESVPGSTSEYLGVPRTLADDAAGATGRGTPRYPRYSEVLLLAAGIAVVRWIPLHDVHVLRELVVLGGSVALLLAIRFAQPRAPVAVVIIAVAAVALVTPVQPAKMTFFPAALAMVALLMRRLDAQLATAVVLIGCAAFSRYSLATLYIVAAIVFMLPLLARVRPLVYGAAAVIFALWPWSGVIARALPLLRNYDAPVDARTIAQALAPGDALPLDIAPHARHAIVSMSGAQMWRMRPGRVVGSIEATDVRGARTTRAIRIGDVADFGFTRREPFFVSRNPLPRAMAADIRGYGASAWVWAGGRTAIATNADIASLRVVAAPDLPGDARLQVDAVEFPAR